MLSMRMDVGPAITGAVLATGHHVVAAFDPACFDLAGEVVDVHDLRERPALPLRPGFGTRREFDAARQLARVHKVAAHESAAPETLRALARAGHGIAIVPTTAHLDTERLRIRPVVFRGHRLTMDLMLFWSVSRARPGYARAFKAMLGEHARAMVPRFG
jgi:LysR family nitrogen assimilation transcriptional regulator